MLAETLALALLLASPGSPRARPGLDAPADNGARARRGLLPRKATKRSLPRGRRIVLLPQAPTWLGEPNEPAPEAELEAVVQPSVGDPSGVEPAAVGPSVIEPSAAEPALAARVEPASGIAPEEAPPALSAALEGAEVNLLLVRRFPVAEPEPEVRVALAEPELVVLVRRLAAP